MSRFNLIKFLETLSATIGDSSPRLLIRSNEADQLFVSRALECLEPVNDLIRGTLPAFSPVTFALYGLWRDAERCRHVHFARAMQLLIHEINFEREPKALGRWSPSNQDAALQLLELTLVLLACIYTAGSDEQGAGLLHDIELQIQTKRIRTR